MFAYFCYLVTAYKERSVSTNGDKKKKKKKKKKEKREKEKEENNKQNGRKIETEKEQARKRIFHCACFDDGGDLFLR